MKTIRLTEYGNPKTEDLSLAQLEQVRRTGLLGISPRPDGRYDLRAAGSTVGTVVTRDVRILIRPKVGLPNVFFLLSYGAGLTDWGDQSFPYERDDLFEAVAWLIDAELSQAARAGLVRDYREREQALATIRGRIDWGAQLRRHHGKPMPIECRYQDYTEDTELNRVLKAALRQLFRVPTLDRALVQRLRHHFRLLTGVRDIHYDPSAVPALTFTRLNEIWRPAAVLSRLVLQAGSVRDATGSVSAVSFTVDMNKLFERFVERVTRDEVRGLGWNLQGQGGRRMAESINVRPDLILRRGRRDLAVADAKYKRVASTYWPNADMYQLLAYCVTLELKHGLLIYAESEGHQVQNVASAGIALETIGVDLSQAPTVVLTQVRKAARRLVEQAQKHAQMTGATSARLRSQATSKRRQIADGVLDLARADGT